MVAMLPRKQASSALSVIQGVFGKDSPYYVRLETETAGIHGNYVSEDQLGACRGIFQGAKSDVDGGYLFDLQTSFSGEIFGDFVSAAKTALGEGHHTVATVLACAALEDALKRFATSKGLSVENKSMEDVVNALKAQGLVTGSQKTLLAAMPKIRTKPCTRIGQSLPRRMQVVVSVSLSNSYSTTLSNQRYE